MGVITSQFIEEAYNHAYKVKNAKELKLLYSLRDKSWPTAADTETTGLHFGVPNVLMENGKIVSEQKYPVVFGISLAWMVSTNGMEKCGMDADWNGLCLAWCRRPTEMFQVARTLLEAPQEKVFHNLKYDLAMRS